MFLYFAANLCRAPPYRIRLHAVPQRIQAASTRRRPPRCARRCYKAHSCANRFNTSGLAAGSYKADICLSGNVTSPASIATDDEDTKRIPATFTERQ